MMTEQTHVKNLIQHKLYLEDLKKEDAYKLLQEVYDIVDLNDFPELQYKVDAF